MKGMESDFSSGLILPVSRRKLSLLGRQIPDFLLVESHKLMDYQPTEVHELQGRREVICLSGNMYAILHTIHSYGQQRSCLYRINVVNQSVETYVCNW